MKDDFKAHIALVEGLVNELEAYVNSCEIYPRTSSIADSVLLGLISKAFSLFRAVMLLAQNDFYDEAYGLARTSVEIRFVVRFLTNQDLDRRAREYFDFGAKVASHNRKLLAEHAPDMQLEEMGDYMEILAAQYKKHFRWSSEANTVEAFAKEPSGYEHDESGKPSTQAITYSTTYWRMSSYVHADVTSLFGHLGTPLKAFKIVGRSDDDLHGRMAVDSTALTLHIIISQIFRAFGIDLLEDITKSFSELFKRKFPEQG